MSRSFLGLPALGTVIVLATLPGCPATGVGDPCTPEQEYNSAFRAFDVKEVSVESKSFQCQTRLCLVNHFQGRVSCPYGQDADGNGNGGDGCFVPGTTTPIDGKEGDAFIDTKKKALVDAQLVDRRADLAVYCSCRCSNVDGRTDDGGNYCACPEGFQCQQLVSSIGKGNEGLTGGYCIKNGTAYDPSKAYVNRCDRAANKCD